MTRWEYLTVKWETSVDSSNVPPTHEAKLTAAQTGQPPLILSEVEGGPSAFDQLGAAGWELVSETVIETTDFASSRGYPNVTAPITVRFRFKRPVE
jgi:hypothetical protein